MKGIKETREEDLKGTHLEKVKSYRKLKVTESWKDSIKRKLTKKKKQKEEPRNVPTRELNQWQYLTYKH